MAEPDPKIPSFDPHQTRVDPDFGKPRVPPKLPQRVPQGASHEFARGQRNISTEAVPQKDIPTGKIAPRGKPTPGAKTEVLSPGKSGPAPRGGGTPTVKRPRPTAPPRTIDPQSAEGLERVAQKIPQEVAAEAQEVARQAGRSGLWSKLKPRLRGMIGPAALVGVAIGIIGFAIFEYATNEALKKISPSTDLTALMPQNNKVAWIQAPYARSSREESDPYWEPNVFQEAVTVNTPKNGVVAFGISLQGWPEQFTNDINVNEIGDGNSDWLCEPFGGYLVCRSLGSYPLLASKTTVVTMQFHLPADELKKYLASPSGSRPVYLIVR